MRVAFRRESDEEHKEPKFELPLPPGPNLVTARGLEMMAAKVAELDAAVAAATDDEVREALKRDQRYWTTRHRTAELAPAPPEDEAGFGSRVTYRLRGKEATVELVGSDEADPATGRIPFTAPLAQALIGLAPGETAAFGDATVEVIALG